MQHDRTTMGDSTSTDSADAHPALLDLDLLIVDLQERAAARNLVVDGRAAPEQVLPTGRAARLARLEEAVLVEAGLHVSPSQRPVVGRFITKLKRLLSRAGWESRTHIAVQSTLFNACTAGYILDLEQELARLTAEVRRQDERLKALEGPLETPRGSAP